jgi:hypothetical protein
MIGGSFCRAAYAVTALGAISHERNRHERAVVLVYAGKGHVLQCIKTAS